MMGKVRKIKRTYKSDIDLHEKWKREQQIKQAQVSFYSEIEPMLCLPLKWFSCFKTRELGFIVGVDKEGKSRTQI